MERPTATWTAPLVVLALALGIMALDAGGIASSLRGILFDAYERHAPAKDLGTSIPPIRVVEVDPASLMSHDPDALTRLTVALARSGAALVVFTFPLPPPALSFKTLLAEIPPGPAFDPARTEIASLPEPEDNFVAALQSMKTVTSIELQAAGAGIAPALKARFLYASARPPFDYAPAFDAGDAPPAIVQAASAGIGVLNLTPDPDGVVRRMPILFRLGRLIAPSLDAETLRLIEAMPALTVRGGEGDLAAMLGLAPGITALEGAREIPTLPDGSFWMRYSDRVPPPLAVEALENSSALAGSIIFVGPAGTRVATPFGPRDVASIEAQGLENLLTGEVLRRPANALPAEMLGLLVFAALTMALGTWIGPLWAGSFALAAIAGGGFVSWHYFAASQELLDAACPGASLALVFAAATLARMLEVGAMRTSLRMAFAESLPPSMVEKIARRPSLLKLDGENRTITYLACGVRGLAGLAASFRDHPADFTRLLQRLLSPLMDEVLVHGGTIERLTADGFSAFWNAPLDDAAHALHACEAASDMSIAASRINEFIAREQHIGGVTLAPVEIGVGIATGSVIAGGFHGYARTGYSVNGDAIGLAGHIQALSPQYGPAVIVSEATAHAAERGFAFLEVDTVAASQSDLPVKLYALLGTPITRASPKFRALQTFHEHIFQAMRARQWKQARELIEQCRKLSGASLKLYDLYRARIDYFEANPPAADWDGAFRPILK